MMNYSVSSRARQALDTDLFNRKNIIDEVTAFNVSCPFDRQYILRALCRMPHESFKIPPELEWLSELLAISDSYQKNVIKVIHPFCYVTVRHGLVTSQLDDEWHTDGFSTKITHLPEQNYIVSNCYPTEYVEKAIDIPNDFDPLVHNLHKYLASQVVDADIRTAKPNVVYCLDPYNIHRRQRLIPAGTIRTFVRISYTPIEIMDDANTVNPMIHVRRYNRDGIKIRNELKEYVK